jgi:acetolactate synthase I/II/III large subunit
MRARVQTPQPSVTAVGAIVLTEAITSYQVVAEHLRASRPGVTAGVGDGSLGWAGGGAVGAKLACAERPVVALTGDDSYLFGAARGLRVCPPV